jgi:ribosomal protein S18 acetylase RimI-like enzyme
VIGPGVPPVVVRERRAGDTRAVRRVARAAWRATYGGVLPDAFVRAVLRRAYDRRRLVEGLADPTLHAFVAEDSEVVGYADVRAREGGVELTRIYVHPARQGQGAGTALLRACVEAAKSVGAPALRVGVDPTNLAAIAWYRRRGFEPAGDGVLTIGRLERPLRTFALPLPA